MTATRRGLLGLLALAPAAVACTSSSEPDRPAPVDPDVALRAAAVVRERALLAAYDAALAARPDDARLAPLRAEHQAHLEALEGASPSGTPSPAAAAPVDLAAAEREAAAAHAAATAQASPGLAALLAQLAASEASHPVALA